MKNKNDLLRQAETDLGLNTPYSKGADIPIHNCWHFSTDGNAIDRIFDDDEDFIAGMNRTFVIVQNYDLLILAFCLMDTHIHYILYGEFDECNKFIHEYVRHTSRHISIRHRETNKLFNLPVHHQVIDTDYYLKVAICYVLKNPPVASLHYTPYDYPWSSGALYFRNKKYWTSPMWVSFDYRSLAGLKLKEKRELLKSRATIEDLSVKVIGNLIFPGEYIEYEMVERLYKSHRSFNYFMCVAKETDVESRGGAISRLTIPIQEMRQYRNEICRSVFKVDGIRMLDINKRVRLAQILRKNYKSSVKQICRLCGLVYEDLKDMIR